MHAHEALVNAVGERGGWEEFFAKPPLNITWTSQN
jgi:hypothetical protein